MGIAELVSKLGKLVWYYNRGTLPYPIRFNFEVHKKLFIVIYSNVRLGFCMQPAMFLFFEKK